MPLNAVRTEADLLFQASILQSAFILVKGTQSVLTSFVFENFSCFSRQTLPHVTLHNISIAINLPFAIGRGLSSESVVSRERVGGAVEMSTAVFKAEWGVSYGHCSTVYITANEGSM